jgi:hypothetical protein
MNPAAIVQLLNLITSLIPVGMQLATDIKSTSSLEDQASVDTALASMVAAANADLTKAEADLDAAAKT